MTKNEANLNNQMIQNLSQNGFLANFQGLKQSDNIAFNFIFRNREFKAEGGNIGKKFADITEDDQHNIHVSQWQDKTLWVISKSNNKHKFSRTTVDGDS